MKKRLLTYLFMYAVALYNWQCAINILQYDSSPILLTDN